jgi:S1-C subfamily serine protease
MRHWTHWLAVFVLACLAVPFLTSNFLAYGWTSTPPAMASAFLKVSDPMGHGSGVHIGNGYVLTAAHVVGLNKTMTILDDEKRAMAGEVLWANAEYDIALLRLPGAAHVESAPLSCAKTYVGQPVKAYGNPQDLDFVFTFGLVNGEPRKWAVWREVVPADLTVIPGQSGGAVVDAQGSVVGITVGVMIWQYGLSGQGFFVPGSAICELMGRA